jgi:hypothetical protein
MVQKDAHKYEFGDQGSVMVIVNDEEAVDHVSYSYDSGKNWLAGVFCSVRLMVADESCRQDLNLNVKIRARVLTTIPDSTSQKFLLIGTLHKSEQKGDKRPHAAIFLDFASLRKKQCTSDQFERWYARTAKGKECLMGHKVGTVTLAASSPKSDRSCFSNGTTENSRMQIVISGTNSQTRKNTRIIAHATTTITNGIAHFSPFANLSTYMSG